MAVDELREQDGQSKLSRAKEGGGCVERIAIFAARLGDFQLYPSKSCWPSNTGGFHLISKFSRHCTSSGVRCALISGEAPIDLAAEAQAYLQSRCFDIGSFEKQRACRVGVALQHGLTYRIAHVPVDALVIARQHRSPDLNATPDRTKA